MGGCGWEFGYSGGVGGSVRKREAEALLNHMRAEGGEGGGIATGSTGMGGGVE